MNTEELFQKLETVKYKSFGFGAVMLWRMTDEGSTWHCGLRNEENWKNAKSFEAETPNGALQKLHDYCIEKGYL